MIYILEDDDSIRKLVTYALESQGYEAAGFALPSAFYKAMKGKQPSLLLLDIMLPEEDGISILRKLRADPATEHLPVIMLTAKSTEYDHVEGLDAGADDYVAKPFGMMELLARVRAVLRRAETGNTIGEGSSSESGNAEKPGMRAAGKTASAATRASGSSFAGETASAASGTFSGGLSASAEEEGAKANTVKTGGGQSSGAAEQDTDAARAQRNPGRGNDVLKYGILRIYPKRYEVYVEDAEITLTNKEYQLLELFARHPGVVFSSDHLMEKIWGWDSESDTGVVWTHIGFIRKKLRTLQTDVEIRTIRGAGYALEVK